MGIWLVSTFWFLWVVLLWTFTYKSLCEHTFSLFLVRYLEVKLLTLRQFDFILFCYYFCPEPLAPSAREGDFIFNILRNCHTIFQKSGCTILHSHWQGMRVLFSASSPALGVMRLLGCSYSSGWKETPRFRLICIFLVTSDVEHVLMCLLDIKILSLEKCFFMFFSHF